LADSTVCSISKYLNTTEKKANKIERDKESNQRQQKKTKESMEKKNKNYGDHYFLETGDVACMAKLLVPANPATEI